jgi:NAD(P)-dependent dehydrogenase (short-subunit alcohol dehydrogenase family)
MTAPLSGEIAIVTGAARGIGLAVADRLIADGAAVAIFDLLADAAEAAAEAHRAAGHKVVARGVDLRDPGAVADAVARVTDELGTPSILVNNAGRTVYNQACRLEPEILAETIETNVTTALVMTRAALPGMLAMGRGRIVNMASGAGIRVVSNLCSYGVSKAALIALTQHFAVELAEKGITVNAIAPGPIETEMLQQNQNTAVRDMLRSAIPADRYGAPAEVASAVAYLVRIDAAYVTGQVLPVDGGLLTASAMLHRLTG